MILDERGMDKRWDASRAGSFTTVSFVSVSTARIENYGCIFGFQILNKIPQTKVILICNH